MNVTGVQIILATREGNRVNVDTWGGTGYAMIPDQWMQAIATYDGNVTMEYRTEESAQAAVDILRQWSEEDVSCRIFCDNRNRRVCITNLGTRQQVANYPLN
jgi:hypothetical protein